MEQQSKKPQIVSNFDLEYRAFDAQADKRRRRKTCRPVRIEFCPECERIVDPRGTVAYNPITRAVLHELCAARRERRTAHLRRLAAERRALVAHVTSSSDVARAMQLALAEVWEARARALAS